MSNKIKRRKKKKGGHPFSGQFSQTGSDIQHKAQIMHLAEQHLRAGNLPKAEKLYRKILDIDPQNIVALNNLGNVLRFSGKLHQAINSYRKALEIYPRHPELLVNIGIVYLESGNIDEAISSFKNAVVIKPDHVKAFLSLGNALEQAGKLDEAAGNYRKALAINPDFAEIHYNLGNIYKKMGQPDKAIASYAKSLALKPDYAEANNNLGNVFRVKGKLDEAIACYKKALTVKPDYAEAQFNISTIFQESGRLDEAIAGFKKTILMKPDYGEAYRTLAAITKHTEYDDEVRATEELYDARGDLSNEDKMHLGFALGKIFEDLGQYDRSFDFISEANRLKRGSYQYSIDSDRIFFERIKEIFSADFFASHQSSGYPDDTPIFIVGMPRSGTTLVEQILASHSLVFGAGELTDLPNLTKSHCAAASAGLFPECALQLEAFSLKDLGLDYITRIRKHSEDVRYITDKLPHNFLRVGLIKVILPQAKVIHCSRDPMDNCLSLFKNYFSARGSHEYAYDQNELGFYYRLYLDLMEHWDNMLPGFMYSLKYEDMVSDQQNQTKKLLEFCGLPWDEACLAFHKTKRRVQTVSVAQVRKPIYTDSVKLWKRYETQLQPLQRALHI